jgi:hypothetical protein
MACAASAWGQKAQVEPHIGYVYPGGGQQGSTFLVAVGGQFLRGAKDVLVSGDGVHATVEEYCRPIRNLKKEERDEIQKRMTAVRDIRMAELKGKPLPPEPARDEPAKGAAAEDGTGQKPVVMPKHPLLYDLESKSLRELAHIRHELAGFRKKQQNAQIGESVVLRVTVDPGAEPGDRELRLKTAAGLTNPMCFQVGVLPEARELEPNGLRTSEKLPKLAPLELPVMVNGQIMPGDVDSFRFHAKQGQKLAVAACARQLVPYMADAVPGWFQATMALYDTKGKEVAFEDDYRFNPDPVLFYTIPEDGVFELEIRDAIYRGREDFVYRIAVSEQPYITQAFPLGARMGTEATTGLAGWNLPETRVPLDTEPGGGPVRQALLHEGRTLSNSIPYAVDMLPECSEKEPNDTVKEAETVRLPQTVNGRIAKAGDVDVFRFEGRAGDAIVAEVHGRRLNSPVDSVLRLTDASGTVVAWNDDYVSKEGHLYTGTGLLTHHADSYLLAELPKDGAYFVHMADSQHHGGDAYAYRLRVSSPQPDFELRVTPSSINVLPGRAAAICVHALRKDGFEGDIEVVLKDAPAGFTLSGGRIPSGRDSIRMTLNAPQKLLEKPVAIRMMGRGDANGHTISRSVVPSEDMMQAFLYRHLTPSQELMVANRGARRPGPPVELASAGPVQVPDGGSATVRIRAPKSPVLKDVDLVLNDPPDGMSIGDVKVVPSGLTFLLKAENDAHKPGFVDNLIVEAFAEVAKRGKGGGKPTGKQRVSLGVLPAIPFEVVGQ